MKNITHIIVAELKMMRFSLEVSGLDRIRKLEHKVGENRLRWFGLVHRKESG